MTDYEAIKTLIKDDIKKSAAELDYQYGFNNLQGFALGTDDDVRTLYHVACTREWVEAQGDDGIAYIFVEWVESGDENLFLSVSKLLNEEADKECPDWVEGRDKRFAAITHALAEIREENIFNADTFLYAGSTDPSDYMEELSLRAAKKINTQQNIEAYIQAMGYLDE